VAIKRLLCLILLMFPPVLLAQEAPQDDGPGAIQFEKTDYKAVEGKTRTISVIRTGGTKGDVQITFETVAGSALAGADFEHVSTVLTIPDGESKVTVGVPVMADLVLEFPERLSMVLRDPAGGATMGERTEIPMRIVVIGNDAVVFGLLMAILAMVFVTSNSSDPRLKKFYKFVPSLLMCYFVPSIFSTLGIISPDQSQLYYVASRYLLPACLVLLCLSIDVPALRRLGGKALIMFFTGTAGIVIGGPLAFKIMSVVSPDTVVGQGAEAVWRGMTTLAGSWIGGGANQTAMKEMFEVGDSVFSALIAVDILVANVWMACILYMAGESDVIDKRTGADNSAIKELQQKISDYQTSIAKIASLTDMMKIAGLGFLMTALGHFLADFLGPAITQHAPDWVKWMGLGSQFFWLIVIATLGGFLLSFTRAREYEGIGASKMGSAFLYVLVATIGMKMDLTAVVQYPGLFVVGFLWIGFHALLLIVMARLIKAPVFFLAVGSQANVGGAASAPIVASAFHPSLAPVGVLLAVLGYFLGTFAAWGCGLMLKWMAGA
jgi:uncharacterized membrane protein